MIWYVEEIKGELGLILIQNSLYNRYFYVDLRFKLIGIGCFRCMMHKFKLTSTLQIFSAHKKTKTNIQTHGRQLNNDYQFNLSGRIIVDGNQKTFSLIQRNKMCLIANG